MADYLDEIVGQETAKQFVRTAIKKGNLYNFLLVGPKGVGKRMFGFAFAKTLGCPPNSPNFLLVGPIPAKLKDKQDKIFEYSKRYLPEYPIIEVEDRSSILIEQIRNIIERLITMPVKGSKRVILIIEADKMTDAAANCFLKTLEEPPMETIFILTTSRQDFLLPTIRSRCQVVPFNYLTENQLKEIIFEAGDEFKLGSPGEILTIKENNLMEKVYSIFKDAPLDIATAANRAKELERKNLIDIFYPLLLFYRLVLYKKLNIKTDSSYETEITKKANNTSLEKVLNTVLMLNYNINILEQNPNHLLLLFNTLIKLP